MKKLVSLIAVLATVTPAVATAAPARAQSIKKDGNGGYNVTYSYQDKAKNKWYGALRADLNFLSWKNEYSSDIVMAKSDDFSFEPLLGVDFAFGKRINYFWRAEVEAGYIAEFSDKDNGTEFSLKLPYVMANGYYDFTNGLYVGAGLGMSFPTTKLDDVTFTDEGNRSKTGVSPMFGLMGGYTYRLDDDFLVDLRYRFAGTWGTTQEREILGTNHIKNKIGFIMDNSISVGIRYEF